ncbi:Ig-like domain-containing protein, partial [Ursidibacter arcticus]
KVNGSGEPIDITKDSTLKVQAKDPKNPNNNSVEAPIAVADANIVKADNTAPTVELAPTPNGAEVTLDPNANVGDTTKVTVEKDGNKVEHEYKVNEDGKWKPTDPQKSPAVNPDGTVTIVAPPGSTISAETADTAGNTNKPQPKPNAEAGDLPTNTVKVPGESDPTQPVDVPKTAQPTAKITKVIDQDSPADGKVDAYEVTGKVPGEPVGTPVRVYDEEGNLLGEGKTTDDEGNFTINPVEKPKSGETLVVKAENPEKQPSNAVKLPTTDVVTDFEDKTAPETPSVTANGADGSVDVSLPENAVPGDTLKIKFTPEGQDTPVEATLTKQPDGSWESDNPLVPDAIDGQDKVTIPENAVKDGTEVTAQNIDVAGNKSPEDAEIAKAIAGSDQTTGKPEITEVKGYDLNEKADTNPDKVVITGKVEGEPAGTKVSIFDKDGKKVAEVETDEDGNFTATLVEKGAKDELKAGADAEVDEINAGDTFTAKAKADSKPDSEESSPKEVTKIEGGNPADHLGDTQDPTAPTLTKTNDAGNPAEKGDGAVKVEFPADAVEGDKAEIKFKDEDNNPVKAVYEKQADGSWKLDPKASENVPENTLPETVNNNDPSFVIPEDKLLDGSEVTATSTDVAGRTKDADPVKAGFDKPVTTPALSEGYPKSQNTSDAPDTNAATEAVLVGTADPKAVIKVKDKDDNLLTPTATANDEGKFTLTIPKADLAKGPFKLIAELTENGTTESSDPTAEIPVAQTVQPGTPDPEATDKESLSKDKGGYPNDNTPPPAPTIDTGLDGAAKVTVGLPADAKNGDKVTITYFDEATGENKEVVVTKAQDGWKVPADSPISQDKINGNNLEIPADSVKDKTEVTARTQDLAGNLSEKKKDTSKYDEVTAQPSL